MEPRSIDSIIYAVSRHAEGADAELEAWGAGQADPVALMDAMERLNWLPVSLMRRAEALAPHHIRFLELRVLDKFFNLAFPNQLPEFLAVHDDLRAAYPQSTVGRFMDTLDDPLSDEVTPRIQHFVDICTDVEGLFRIARKTILNLDQYEVLIRRILALEPNHVAAMEHVIHHGCPPCQKKEMQYADRTLMNANSPSMNALTGHLVCADHFGAHAEVIAAARLVLSHDPSCGTAHILLLMNLYKSGEVEAAARAAEEALLTCDERSSRDTLSKMLTLLRKGKDPFGDGYSTGSCYIP